MCIRDSFGVGLGTKFVAFVDQLLLQRDVVLHNAVVHDNDLAGAIAVGMRVLLRGAAMRGPAGMADAVGAVERLQADDLFQVAQLALGAAHLQATAVAGHSNAGGVIAAIFKATQAVNDDRHNSLFSDVSNNPAHNSSPNRSCRLPVVSCQFRHQGFWLANVMHNPAESLPERNRKGTAPADTNLPDRPK